MDNLDAALKEIGFCKELKVNVEDGLIVCICKQVVQRPERAGVKTQHIIDREITK